MKASLRLRIALMSTVLSGMVMMMFGAGAWWMAARQKTAALDARIRALGTRQPGWVFRDRDFLRLEENMDFVLGSPDGADPHFLWVAETGGPVLHQSTPWPAGLDTGAFTNPLRNAPVRPTPDAPDAGLSIGGHGPGGGFGRGRGGGQALHFDKQPEFFTVETRDGRWRVGRFGSDVFTMVIGLGADASDAELRQLRNTAALAIAALLLIGLGGWIVAGRALRPLRLIAASTSRVTSRGLDQRIPCLDGDPEITRLVDMLNGMMDRLEAGFRQATRFSADASHELKTPLAIMRGEIEQALQQAEPGSSGQRTLNSLLEETHRLGAIIRSLLLLSRADAGQLVTHRKTVDLSELTAELVEDTAAFAETMDIRMESEINPDVLISGDADLLRTALLNLLNNAVKHNQADGWVSVRLTKENASAVLEIANTGPPITPEERVDIFERFHRGQAARDHARDGVGLGLSLAREIITAHGGTLTLAEDRGDSILRFLLQLPTL